MKVKKVEDALLPIVRRYGFDSVHKALHEIGTIEVQCTKRKQHNQATKSDMPVKSAKRNYKPTAVEYVLKMQIPMEKKPVLLEIAQRFQGKCFLPTSGDISNFCRIYGIDEPASKTRSNAIPRVFKLIATMELDDIQRILDAGMFSGPSKLGPIADAIRNNGRAKRPTFN